MNTNITEIFDSLREEKELERVFDKAENLFGWKPFAKEHLLTNKIALAGRWVFGGLSILSGLAVCFTFPLPIYLTLPFVFLLLFAVELGKSAFVLSTLRVWFEKGKLSKAFPFALLLFSLSVFVSFSGAESLGVDLREDNLKELQSEQTEKTKEVIGEVSKEREDLKSYYDFEINKADQLAEEFKNTNQVPAVRNGKRTSALRIKDRPKYAELLDNAQALRDKREEALTKLDKEEKEKRNVVFQQSQAKGAQTLKIASKVSFFLIGGAVLNELLIMGLLYFSLYYYYKSREEALLSTSSSQTFNIDSETLGGLVELANMRKQSLEKRSFPLMNEAPKNSIGFKSTLKKEQGFEEGEQQGYFKAPLKAQAVKHSDYLEKYPKLCEDLHKVNKGEMKVTVKELSKAHNVSEGLIYRVKKAIFV